MMKLFEKIDFVRDFVNTEFEFEDFDSAQLAALEKQAQSIVTCDVPSPLSEIGFYNFKRFIIGIYESLHVNFIVDETVNNITIDEAVKSLHELYPAINNVIDEFTSEDLDSVTIIEGVNITFCRWESGVPVNYTYDFDGNVINYYNPEIDKNMEENFMNNETINNATVNKTMEGEEMRKETINETAATTEEVTMGEKAKNFAENAKEKLTEGFEYIVNNVDGVAEEVKKMADMNDAQLEQHLTIKGKEIFNKIMNKVKKYHKDMKDNSDICPELEEEAEKSMNIIKLIKDVLDEEELSGWGKFKAIVKELVKWLLRLLLKVGAIVLKLALTVAVGVIKIGATALVTTGKVIGVLNREVVKPSIKAGKDAWNTHKTNKATKAEEKEFQEVREALFGVDEE